MFFCMPSYIFYNHSCNQSASLGVAANGVIWWYTANILFFVYHENLATWWFYFFLDNFVLLGPLLVTIYCYDDDDDIDDDEWWLLPCKLFIYFVLHVCAVFERSLELIKGLPLWAGALPTHRLTTATKERERERETSTDDSRYFWLAMQSATVPLPLATLVFIIIILLCLIIWWKISVLFAHVESVWLCFLSPVIGQAANMSSWLEIMMLTSQVCPCNPCI